MLSNAIAVLRRIARGLLASHVPGQLAAGFTLGMLVAVAILGVRCADVAAQEARATARATAFVSSVHVNDDNDTQDAADLTWTDSRGVEHVTFLQVGEPLHLEAEVAVRYDPGDPGGLVFPAEAEAFPPPGDWQRRYLLGMCAAYVLLRRKRKDSERVVVGWQDGSELELRPGTAERDRLVAVAGGALR